MKRFRLVILILTLAFLAPLLSQQALAAGGDTLKIGVLLPKSGVFAEAGRVIEMGLKIAMDEVGYKVAGRPVELIIEDTEGKAATGLAKAKKLVESDKVAFLMGTYSSSVALAVRDYVNTKEIPLLILGGAVTVRLSTTQKSPWVLRGSTVSSQYAIGLATYLAKVKGYKKMVALASDYVYGREALEVISAEFKKAGGEVLDKIFVPFGTMDFAPYLAKINPNADVVLGEFAGADSIRMVKQYKGYGLWNKWPLTGPAITIDENLPAMGDAGVGIVGSLNYCFNLDTPANKKLVAAMQKKFGELPGHVTPSAYEMTKAAILAIEKLKGNLADKKAFMDIILDTNFEGPRGPFKFEKSTGSVINTVYIRKIIKKDGKYTFDILKTIPDVTPSMAISLMGK